MRDARSECVVIPVLRSSLPQHAPTPMPKLSPALQRIIMAFTTGLFLACAAQVSQEGDGFAAAVGVTSE